MIPPLFFNLYGRLFTMVPDPLRKIWVGSLTPFLSLTSLQERVRRGMDIYLGPRSDGALLVKRNIDFLVSLFHQFVLLSFDRGWERRVEGVRVEGEEILREALQDGKGAFLVTSHYGPFLFALSKLTPRYPFSIVVRRLKDRRWEGVLERTRRRIGLRTIYAERAPLKVRSALKEGRGVIFFLDQYLVPGLSSSRKDKAIEAFQLLTSRTEAPVILFFCRQGEGGEVGIEFLPPLKDPSPERIREIMEREIMRQPHLWFWWMRLGKKKRRRRDVLREGR